MTWVAVGASVLGGGISFLGSKSAGRAQERAAAQSIAEQRRQFDAARADQAPFLKTGTAANARLAALLGLDPAASGGGELMRPFTQADIDADPVYQSGLQFGLDEGRNAINSRAIAGGGYDSGATLKALTRFGTDYGSTKANESYNRWTNDQSNIYNRLAGVSGTGQTAANQVQAAGTNAANMISGSYGDAGNARAASIVGGANAFNQALGGAANAYNRSLDNKALMRLLESSRGGHI